MCNKTSDGLAGLSDKTAVSLNNKKKTHTGRCVKFTYICTFMAVQ